MDHDVVGIRLGIILGRLFEGEIVYLAALANEFNVSQKTIRRDLHERLGHLEIERVREGGYRLSGFALGVRRSDSDIMRLAKVTSMDELFPSFDRKLIANLLACKGYSPFVIYTPPLKERLGTFSGFHVVIEAIINRQLIDFNSQGKVLSKFEPYRLIYVQQEWYLVGKHHDRLTVFPYCHITNVEIKKEQFNKDDKVLQLTDEQAFICALPHFQYVTELYNQLERKG